jgi:hypothetical protein
MYNWPVRAIKEAMVALQAEYGKPAFVWLKKGQR